MNRFNVPVFLIYAGIIHAIGLALLLPIVVTLPGSGGDNGPGASLINVEILPASPLAGKVEVDEEQTSALPPPGQAEEIAEDAAAAPGAGEQDGAQVEPDVDSAASEPEAEELAAEPEVEESAALAETSKVEGARSAGSRQPVAKKSVAAPRSKGKSASRRPVKSQSKIAPFDGALSGLFSPGSPATPLRNLRR